MQKTDRSAVRFPAWRSEEPMTLEQLRIFVAVAERQHVTQAAHALNLAQSAASHAIAALEARHQAKLFKRVGRRIELTEAGQVFLDEARAVLARAEAAELTLSEFGGLKRGTLSVQASQTIASYWLPRHLVSFKKAYPEIQIRLTIGNTAQVAAAVENGTAELGFVEGAVEGGAACLRAGGAGPAVCRGWAGASLGRGWTSDPGGPGPRGMGAARARIGHQIGLRGNSGCATESSCPRCRSGWSCPRTRRCGRPSRRASAPRRFRPRWRRRALKPGCCTGRNSRCLSAYSTPCAKAAATGRGPPRR